MEVGTVVRIIHAPTNESVGFACFQHITTDASTLVLKTVHDFNDELPFEDLVDLRLPATSYGMREVGRVDHGNEGLAQAIALYDHAPAAIAHVIRRGDPFKICERIVQHSLCKNCTLEEQTLERILPAISDRTILEALLHTKHYGLHGEMIQRRLASIAS